MKRPGAWLLDANLLVALVHDTHVHHALTHRWFDAVPNRPWATCAITQLAFLRLTTNPKVVGAVYGASHAMNVLTEMTSNPAHTYWSDLPEPARARELTSPAVVGHRQITDAYLLALAIARGERLATLDRGLQVFAAAIGRETHLEWLGEGRPFGEPRARHRPER